MKIKKIGYKGKSIATWVLVVALIAIGLINPSASNAQTFQWPVDPHYVSQSYDVIYTNGKYHSGMDIFSSPGTLVIHAAASGIVKTIPLGTYIHDNHHMGNVVIIDHNNGKGPFSLYAHLALITVADGQCVNKEDKIGIMGNTGTNDIHLHFEVKMWGVLGSVHDDSGPQCADSTTINCNDWGYTFGHPNLYGYIDPYPYLEYNINDINPTPIRVTASQLVRTRPDTSSDSHTFAKVSAGQKFVAFSECNGWYQVYLPSNYGPATGWIQGTIESANYAMVNDPNNDPSQIPLGVKVRSDHTTSVDNNKITYVWDKQHVVISEQWSGSDPKCTRGQWYRIYLPDGLSYLTGWVCGDFLIPKNSETLSVSLTADPPSGPVPLNGVDLTATVSGTATGNVNYTFYCNRPDSGTNITCPNDGKFPDIPDITKVVVNACNYSSPGTYTAKVIAERGGLQAECRTPVTVNPPGGALSVTPSDGLSSSGVQGGSFYPQNKTYKLQNTGGTTINWTVSKNANWVDISNTSGILISGGTTTVTVSININAKNLSPNTYNDTISFTNITNGNGNQTRSVSLTVNSTCPTPGTPSNPFPIDQSTAWPITPIIIRSPTLKWDATANADYYDVYFGTDDINQPKIASNITNTTYPLHELNLGSGYWWKIVAKKNCGTSMSGPVWRFDTDWCASDIWPENQFFPADRWGASVMVSAHTGCSWTATSNENWINITFNSGGSGSGWIEYWVENNQSSSPHSGTITIAGQTVTVNQAGATDLIRNLSVAASNANGGVNIAVSPSDKNGYNNNSVNALFYDNNTPVTLRAPSSANSNNFQRWQRNGADYSFNRSAGITMDNNYGMTAVYAAPPPDVPFINNLQINNGADYTSSPIVTLTYDLTGSPILIRTSTGTSWSGWQTLPLDPHYVNLGGTNGIRDVFVQVKDAAGGISSVAWDQIILDTTAPKGAVKINGGASTTNINNVHLHLAMLDANMNHAKMRVKNDISFVSPADDGLWQNFATGLDWTLSVGTGTKKVYVQFKDDVGKVSLVYSASINVTATGAVWPGVSGININDFVLFNSSDDESNYTTGTLVKLNATVSDTNIMARYLYSGSWTSWETPPTPPLDGNIVYKALNLPSTNGVHQVYIQLKENATGKMTDPKFVSIILDTTNPNGSIQINNGDGSVKQAGSITNVNLTITATDVGSGIEQMAIYQGAAPASPNPADFILFNPSVSYFPLDTSSTGTKNLYIWFKDRAGRISSRKNDSINVTP